MAKSPDIWMPLYIGDYLADTMHLTTEEHGAYLLLLMAYWKNRGPLPDIPTRLAGTCRLTLADFERLRPTLVAFFRIVDGFWVHDRVDEEIARTQAVHARNTANGARGGRPKTQTITETEPKNNPNDKRNRSIPQSQPQSENKKQEKGSAQKAPPLPTLFPEKEGIPQEATPKLQGTSRGDYLQDPVWNAVARLFGFLAPHTPKEAKRLGAVVRDLRGFGAKTGEEVEACFKLAQKAWNGGPPFSPEALVKWWRPFREQAGRANEAKKREFSEWKARREEQMALAEDFHARTGTWPWWHDPAQEPAGQVG